MNRTATLFLAVCTAAVALSACGGSSDEPADPPAPAAAALAAPPRVAVIPADFFARPASPVTVTSTVDDGRAVKGTLGRSGGALAATGADGSRFTFVVPAGALPDDVEITMTPIVSSSGAPWTRAVGARFAPAGLQFFQYATLAIEPAGDIPLDRQVMTGASDQGELFLATPDVLSRAARVKILHFSDYWVAEMTPDQLSAQRLRTPSAAALQIENEVNAVLNNLRQRQLLGESDEAQAASTDELLEAAVQQWWELVLKPRIAAARHCDDWNEILAGMLSVERQRQLLGGAEDDVALLDNTAAADVWGIAGSGAWMRANVPFGGSLVKAGGFQCAADSSERCTARHLFDLVDTAIRWERQKQLLGLDDDPAFESTYLQFDRRLDACYRVRVEFDSRVTIFGTPGAREATTAVSSSLEHRIYPGGLDDVLAYANRALQGDAGIPTTSATLQNTALEVTGPSCGSVSNIAPGAGSLRLDFSFPASASGRPATAILRMRLGDTAETWTLTGCGQGSVRYGPRPLWTEAFLELHRTEAFDRPGIERGIDVQLSGADLPLNGGEVVASTQWLRTVGSLAEETTLRLVHVPQAIAEPAPPAPR